FAATRACSSTVGGSAGRVALVEEALVNHAPSSARRVLMQSILRPRRLTGLPVLIVALGLLLWTSDCSSHYVELRRAQAQERSEVQQRGDTQQAVAVTSSERDAVRREMRTMMRSLNFVLQGLADGNVATIEQAARRSGKVTTLDGAFREK